MDRQIDREMGNKSGGEREEREIKGKTERQIDRQREQEEKKHWKKWEKRVELWI